MHLDSEVKSVSAWIHAGSLEQQIFKAEQVEIKKIQNAVTESSRIGMQGFLPLSKSLDKNGMKDPLIIILNNEKNWTKSHRKVLYKYRNDADYSKKYIALTGNSRLVYAKIKGYLSISCILVPNFIWFHSVQLQLQDGIIEHEL